MNHSAISHQQAATLPALFYPGVLEEDDATAFWYFCASDERGILGAIAVDPRTTGACLKSIAVSPLVQRQGIALSLIRHACQALADHNITRLTAELALEPEKWMIVGPLLNAASFGQYELESYYYTSDLANINSNLQLRKIQERAMTMTCPLSDVPGYVMRGFYAELHKNKLVDPMIFESCDPSFSVVYYEKDQLLACVLLADDGQGGIENVWAYQKSAEPRPLLMLCIAKAIAVCQKKYPPETPVWVMCLNKASDALTRHLWPDVTLTYAIRTYHRTTVIPTYTSPNLKPPMEAPEGWFPPSEDPDDFKPTLDTGADTVCVQCKHRLENKVLSCQWYKQKPGNVIYGGSCPQFNL